MSAITPVSELVQKAKSKIMLIGPADALKKMNEGNIVFVDIRDIRELWKEAKIKNAYHAPRGMLEFWVDPKSPYFKSIFGEYNHYILYCASGWRSALAVLTLTEMGMIDVSSLEGGFSLWKKLGYPIEAVEQT